MAPGRRSEKAENKRRQALGQSFQAPPRKPRSDLFVAFAVRTVGLALYLFPVASGVIAGGALMGVVLVFWENGAEMLVRR